MPKAPPDPLYTLKGDTSPVHSLCFWANARNEKVFAGCQSGQVQLWSLKSNRSVEGLQAHSGPCINVSCYNDHLITQGKGDGQVKLWHSLEGGGWASSFTIYTRHSIFCRFSILEGADKGNPMIVCPDDNHSVAVYSLHTGERWSHLNFEDLNTKSKNLGYVMALKCFNDPHNNNPMLLVAHEGGQISLRDLLNGGREMCSVNVGEPILCLEFDPWEGTGIYGSPESPHINKFTINTQTGTCELGSRTSIMNPGISSVDIRPDFKIVATGGWDGRLRIFSWQRTPMESNQNDAGSVVEKKEDVATQSLSQEIKLSGIASDCSLEASEVKETVDAQQMQETNNVAVTSSTETERICTSLCRGSTHLEVVPAFKKPMKPLAVLKHHTKTVQCVTFSRGPVEAWESTCLLAAGSDDGGISLWDIYN